MKGQASKTPTHGKASIRPTIFLFSIKSGSIASCASNSHPSPCLGLVRRYVCGDLITGRGRLLANRVKLLTIFMLPIWKKTSERRDRWISGRVDAINGARVLQIKNWFHEFHQISGSSNVVTRLTRLYACFQHAAGHRSVSSF